MFHLYPAQDMPSTLGYGLASKTQSFCQDKDEKDTASVHRMKQTFANRLIINRKKKHIQINDFLVHFCPYISAAVQVCVGCTSGDQFSRVVKAELRTFVICFVCNVLNLWQTRTYLEYFLSSIVYCRDSED